MKTNIFIPLLFVFFLLNACATVQTKLDEKAKEEQERLSVYIGKNIDEVFIDFGKPYSDGLNEQGFREVTFKLKKIGINCIRTFDVGKNNNVLGFESSGCF